jgi:ABC-2 type transport system permease protein
MRINKALIAYLTILRTEFKKIFRLWAQTLLPAAITTTLYFLIFGHLMGQRIGSMSGLPYLNFIVPGLIIMTMLTSAFTASSSLFYMYKWSKVLEEILVSPMSSSSILNSFMSVGILRAMVVGFIVLIIAEFFTHAHILHYIYVFLIALLAAGIFSLLGVLNAIFAKTFDHINIIPTFIITPLTYLGGVFYSINILPTFWQHVTFFNPVVYIVSLFRYAFYGYVDINVYLSTIVMLVVFVALYLICLFLIKTRRGVAN